MNRLGVELLSVLGMPPVDFVHLVADLGCTYLSTDLTPLPVNPHGYPPWSLRDDSRLRRNMISAMRARSVHLSLGEGFIVRPDADMRDKARDMDIMADLGARGVGGTGMDPDMARAKDEFACLAAMAHERGMIATIEFVPGLPVGTLAQALEIVSYVDEPCLRVLIDAMHFFRSGGAMAELAACDAAQIGYAQLCDVPLVPADPDYMREATFERRPPGEGDLPLADFMAALPQDIPIGLEIPSVAAARAGMSPMERLRPAVEAARALGA